MSLREENDSATSHHTVDNDKIKRGLMLAGIKIIEHSEPYTYKRRMAKN